MSKVAGVNTKQLNIAQETVGAVLVVGGGIAGMQAAADLAEGGFAVYLITRDESLGGRMARLDKTFPTNECSMCLLGPKMTGSSSHANIKLLTRAELLELKGEAGNFTALVNRQPRFVDESRCTGCGQCAEVCPVQVLNEFNDGLNKRKAVYKQFPQAVPNKYAIDIEHCIKCMKCVRACNAQAIDHNQQPEILEISVGAVILAPGFETFDVSRLAQYGWGSYPNVVTNIQFERILSPSGPSGGRVLRPSDHTVPKRLAFIQCVGSRDCRPEQGIEYCSAVCCMAAVKEALIAKEYHPEMQGKIFYLDMRAYGKNFDRYVKQARNLGIVMQRSLVSAVQQDEASGNLKLNYFDGKKVVVEEFDMVVLGVGVRPPETARRLAQAAGIQLNRYGFALVDRENPVKTTRTGVFAAGGFLGPRDIPETVVNGSAAAAAAAELLAAARGRLVQPAKYSEETASGDQPPRVGVFVCRCGTNIAGVVDVPAVVDYAAALPNVVHAQEFTYTCSQESQQKIKQQIAEKQLNRVVVAACSIRTHQSLFRQTLQEAGLNQYYLEMANIRDQCSWVHRDRPAAATAKAKDLTAMAAAKAAANLPLHLSKAKVVPRALVVGGGIAGLTAALTLANQGYGVYLLEREKELGGMLRHLFLPQKEIAPQELLAQKVSAVKEHPNITVYQDAELVDISGRVGEFVSVVRVADTELKLKHGVVIVATGTRPAAIKGFLYGRDERVITLLDMEKRLSERPLTGVKGVAFILCADSRRPGREYCSRTCCRQSVRQAYLLKKCKPDTDVYVLYRDMRTYGFSERDYFLARKAGVIFINYALERQPVINENGGCLTVDIYDPLSSQNLNLTVDLVVLAGAAEPAAGVEKLAGLLKLPFNEDRFFMEAHVKLAPLDTSTAGVFICGGAHSPQNICEAIAQAQGAAARAATVLSKEYLLAGGVVAKVNPEKCAACLTCVRVCPFGVPRLIDERAEISALQCQGCGICASACPNRAIELEHYRTEQLTVKIKGMLSKGGAGRE